MEVLWDSLPLHTAARIFVGQFDEEIPGGFRLSFPKARKNSNST